MGLEVLRFPGPGVGEQNYTKENRSSTFLIPCPSHHHYQRHRNMHIDLLVSSPSWASSQRIRYQYRPCHSHKCVLSGSRWIPATHLCILHPQHIHPVNFLSMHTLERRSMQVRTRVRDKKAARKRRSKQNNESTIRRYPNFPDAPVWVHEPWLSPWMVMWSHYYNHSNSKPVPDMRNINKSIR